MALRPIIALSSLLLLVTAGPLPAAEPDVRLVTAVAERNQSAIDALLTARVNVNATRPDGATALLWAAHWNDLGLVQKLLKAGAKVTAADDNGMTPLALACENASAPMVTALLAHGADPNRAQENGVTPIMTAARTGNVEVLKILLARGARVNAVIPSSGQTALMWATSERHLDVVRELLAAGADVHAESTLGFSPLLFAARNGDIDAGKMLLNAGAGVDDRGADGTQALPLAIVSGQHAFALFLLDQGADPNATMAGVGALHAAAGNVDVWLRDWLRARRMSVHARSTAGLDPAHRAEMVKALLAHGADPNAPIVTPTIMGLGVSGRWGAFDIYSVGTGDLKGATPLWVAAFVANGAVSAAARASALSIVRDLLDAGADPGLATDDGTTPLMVAAGLGRQSYQPGAARGTPSPGAEGAVKMLVEAGADLNAVNEGAFTALHGAAFRGLNEVVQYLVEKGADINARDFQGRTAFRIAQGTQQGFRVQSWPETAKFIEGLGADTAIAPLPGADGQAILKVGEGGTAGKRETGAAGTGGDLR
jgi:ankyrin repeat protein